MFKSTKLIVIFLLLCIVFCLYYALFKLDASSVHLDPYLIPESANTEYRPRHPVILVSYGDGPQVFMKNQNGLAQSAVNKGFDIIMSYRKGHVDPEYYTKNKAIFDQPNGAGYWVWKPYVILKTLKQYPDD